MAPDLTSVAASPRNIASSSRPTSSTSSRRASQLMGPPPLPFTSPGGTLPHQSFLAGQTPFPPPVSNMTGSTTSPDNAGVGLGPGPLRHPRPLTAADLHLQLEKEQEAVVNRLTRELSLLRQQSASVVSNASSTSTGIADSTDHHANHLISGASHPTPSRRHRSSSSVSTRSITTPATTTSGSTINTTGGVAGSTVSGITPARDHTNASTTSQAAAERARGSLSRQNSMTSSRRSGTSSPSMSSSLQHADHFLHSYSNRHSIASQHGAAHPQPAQLTHAHPTMTPDNPRSPSTTRYEEAAYHRSELETVKRENETLRRRIRELERSLSARRNSQSHSHSHSEPWRRSTSTTADTGTGVSGTGNAGSIAGKGARNASDKEDDEIDESESVRVGESAGSVGVGGGQ